MTAVNSTIVARSFDGAVRKTWHCRLLEQENDLLVFAGEFVEDVSHPELGLIERGTISDEYYWLGRWYNIFRFTTPGGELRNYYCNVNMPPIFEDGILEYVDLDLDLLIWPDLSYEVLDRDDFLLASKRYNYSADIIENAENALKTLISFAESGNFPI